MVVRLFEFKIILHNYNNFILFIILFYYTSIIYVNSNSFIPILKRYSNGIFKTINSLFTYQLKYTQFCALNISW